MKLEKFSLFLLFFLFLTTVNSQELETLKDKHEYSFYTGTFDLLDKEGDDQTSLFGIEHQNEDLFRETFLGKFSPITGGFMTGKSSVYLYTGIQAEYDLGPINIIPSFSPGYYDSGDGKNLGSALEFKSEIKFDIDIFKDSKIGYSYNHISNNDWGDINPGTDNQQISISSKF
jgi:lipid A 3-O-deacylase